MAKPSITTRDACERLHGLGAAIGGRLHREATRLRADGRQLEAHEAAGIIARLAHVIGQDVARLQLELKEGRAAETAGERVPLAGHQRDCRDLPNETTF
jgi:hypothetical protein